MNLKSKIQNLKLSHRRRPRGAVTIVEVLFAILVATVGIFSVVAIFPFASSQARRARINDMLANAGRGAFHDFDARGMRRQDRWLACNPQTGFIVPATGVLQKYESICIDPRMIAAHTTTSALNTNQPPIWPSNCVQQVQPLMTATQVPGGQCVQVFPYVQPGTTPYLASTNPIVFNGYYMRRITLWSGATNGLGNRLAMTLAQANSIFQVEDDIAYQRPSGPSPQFPNDTRTSGARQDATLIYGTTPQQGEWLKRDSERKISWIATLVPQLDVSGVLNDEYTLSVVMIYERANDLDNLEFPSPIAPTSVPMKERRLIGALQTTGATGGEIRIASLYPDQLKLKPNEWVMLSGTYIPPGSTTPLTRFQWYRITECDSAPELIVNTSGPPMYQINATLMGQDWNTSYIVNPTLVPPPFQLQSTEYPVAVDVVQGAFAVYEKTIRLEYGSSM